MKESSFISEYIPKVITISNQLKINGKKLEDVRIMEKVLYSSDHIFEYSVVTIKKQKTYRIWKYINLKDH